jgi:UDP-N-acetyl-D-mannosaminuronic acid dehydrogenase
VLGAWTPTAAAAGVAFYQTFVDAAIDPTDCLTAELVKTTENAYRDVQIAFANEVALLCEDYGADVWAVRDLVNKAPYRDMHLPGAGVGGHCIPKDPWLLVASAAETTPLRLIPAARQINDSMPVHVGARAQATLAEHGRRLADARVVVLGASYLPNSSDVRNAPSESLVDWLQAQGATTVVHDPHVPAHRGDVARAVEQADCLILMVAHPDYARLELASLAARMRTPILIDGRHAVAEEAAVAAGFTYRCVGVGRAS